MGVTLDVIRRFFIPSGDVIEEAGAIGFAPNQSHVRLLVGRHKMFADERRVADDEDVVGGREDFAPVGAEGVGDADGRCGAEGQAAIGAAKSFG